MNRLLIFISALIYAANAYSLEGAGYPTSGRFNLGDNDEAECGWADVSTIIFQQPLQAAASYYIDELIQWSDDGVGNANNGDNVDLSLIPATGYSANTITGLTIAGEVQLFGTLTWGAGDSENNAGIWVRIPEGQVEGMYVLRFVYDNYYSCRLVNVSTPVQPLYTASSVDSAFTWTPGDVLHFQTTEFNRQAVYAALRGPSATPITMFVGALYNNNNNNNQQQQDPNLFPQPGNSLETLTTATLTTPDGVVYAGICLDGALQTRQTYRFTLDLDANLDQQAIWSAGIYPFPEGRIDVGDGARNIQLPHGNYMYFYTTAKSSEADGKVRTVLRVPAGGSLPVEFSGATNCAFTQKIFTTKSLQGDSTALCLDIPENNNNNVEYKYIKVGAMTGSYTIQTEKGSCDSAASTVAVSLVLLCALLFLTML